MEYYFIIDKNGVKQGPFNLFQLQQQKLIHDQLVWRSDSDQWKKALEYEELRDILIIEPPPTPKEKEIKDLNNKFINQVIIILIALYFLSALIITIVSTEIAILGYENKSFSRYPSYYPDRNNEAIYGNNQSFWFRSFRAFGGTIYLSNSEQEDKSKLRVNLFFSSIGSLLPIFLTIGFVYYAVKRTTIGDKPLKKESTTYHGKV